jgi:hypothetical protein
MRLCKRKSVPVMAVLALFIVFGAVGEPGVCTAESPPDTYYVTIEKFADPSILTLALGEPSTISYTIRLRVWDVEPVGYCYLTLSPGECIKVTDSGYTVPSDWKVCYDEGPGIYDFSYPKELPAFEACGDYSVGNTACIEYNPTVTPVPCCNTVTVLVNIPCGGEGCTPGYWKQEQHFDSWPSDYDPEMLFSAVFVDAFPGQTLLDVLELHGGGLNALGRHTVAALLNAASAGVGYDFTLDDVIESFNAVYPGSKSDYNSLKNDFESSNEQGCPLD